MAQSKNIKITCYGGLHNSQPINILIPREKYQTLVEDRQIRLFDILTPAQEKRLSNHFCGIAGCLCGSYQRAYWEVADND